MMNDNKGDGNNGTGSVTHVPGEVSGGAQMDLQAEEKDKVMQATESAGSNGKAKAGGAAEEDPVDWSLPWSPDKFLTKDGRPRKPNRDVHLVNKYGQPLGSYSKTLDAKEDMVEACTMFYGWKFSVRKNFFITHVLNYGTRTNLDQVGLVSMHVLWMILVRAAFSHLSFYVLFYLGDPNSEPVKDASTQWLLFNLVILSIFRA